MSEFASAGVANRFVELAGCPLPQMKLHKLTYMAHGWNLAISGRPLVCDHPEAWDNGPVFRLIWDHVRDYGLDSRGRVQKSTGKPYEAEPSAEQEKVLEHVWKKYGKYSQFTLSDMTHEPGTPWTEIYFSKGRDAIIPDGLIRKHYTELAMAGRD